MTDQQSSWTLGCYGAQEIDTPNIDALADQGTRFTNFFTNSACCTPSRGCFFTGLYPHQHGAPFNDLPLRRDAVTLGHALSDYGYDTGYIGKWHLDGDKEHLAAALHVSGLTESDLLMRMDTVDFGTRSGCVPRSRSMGFADSRWMISCTHAKRVEERPDGTAVFDTDTIGDETTYMTDWLTSKAIDFLDESRDVPFFLTLSIPDPHDPFSVRPPYDTMFAPHSLSIPETFRQTDLPDWMYGPGVTKWHKPDRVVGNAENLRRAKAQYLGEVKCIDDSVGRLVAALEARGLLDNTVVIFTTDHGEYMGEHGIYAKNQLYETAYHIPFIVRYPGIVSPGTTVDEFVTTVDVQQTILGMLGLPSAGTECGRDASPFLRRRADAHGSDRPDGSPPSGARPNGDASRDWTNEAFIYGTAYNRAGIFTPDFELAYVKEAQDHILFDRRTDPLQVHNLFKEPAYRSTVSAMTERLIEHNRAIGAPEVKWLERLAVNT